MTIALFIFRRRRAIALCGASVLLHLLALVWLLPQLDRAGAQGAGSPIDARLIMMPPLAEPEPAAPVPKPARRRAPPAAMPVAVDPPVLASATAPDSQVGAAEKVTDVQSAQPDGAASAPVVAATLPGPEAAPAAEAGEPAAAPAVRQYRVSMPPSARIVLDVARRDADGTLWHGEAAMAWKLAGDSYSMKLEAGLRVIVTRVNLVVLESEGKVGSAGFAPVLMTEKRRGRSLTATHFGAQGGRITFSASTHSYPMVEGTQDKATVPLQLAAIARGDSSQLEGGIDMLVGEDKDATLFRFVLLGLEEIDTKLGKVQAWHLSRPPRAGAYGSRLDVWLAPAYGWYPVQISNIEASGAVTTQTVNKIEVMDSGT
jgi:hypothetical protein